MSDIAASTSTLCSSRLMMKTVTAPCPHPPALARGPLPLPQAGEGAERSEAGEAAATRSIRLRDPLGERVLVGVGLVGEALLHRPGRDFVVQRHDAEVVDPDLGR